MTNSDTVTDSKIEIDTKDCYFLFTKSQLKAYEIYNMSFAMKEGASRPGQELGHSF